MAVTAYKGSTPGFCGSRASSSSNGLGKIEIWHIKLKAWVGVIRCTSTLKKGKFFTVAVKRRRPWEKYARKDVYRIGTLSDSTASVDMAIRFREFAGTYVEHCHNTQHEDKAMLLRWDIQNPGQTLAIPTPMPDWDGVQLRSQHYVTDL